MGEQMWWFSRKTCCNVIVMILTSLNSPEERVLSCGAPRDSRKLDRVSVCVSSLPVFSFLRDYSSLLCKTIWSCAVIWVNLIGYHPVWLWCDWTRCEVFAGWSWRPWQEVYLERGSSLWSKWTLWVQEFTVLNHDTSFLPFPLPFL